ncbi:MAG: flagellar biosynthetic protein FliO [Rhodocyclaceae bacterium]|nr:flagellar biosynthetic protein FliO [Rhodocyclaceae bacterium]
MSPRFALLVPLLLTPAVWAADAVSPAPTIAAAAPDLGSSALQMVFGLIVVLALLLGALWLLKRISMPRGPVAGLLRVVAGVAVGSRERVVILELGNSWLVLGVAPGQVTTLAEIPRQEIPASATGTAAKDFPAWLKQVMKNRDQT